MPNAVVVRTVKLPDSVEEKQRPRCSYHFTYREDQRERGVVVAKAGDIEKCGRAESCPICHQCRYGEKSGHCPGHQGVLSYLLPEDQRPVPLEVVDEVLVPA